MTTKRTSKSLSPTKKKAAKPAATNGDVTPPRTSLRLREKQEVYGDISPPTLTQRVKDVTEVSSNSILCYSSCKLKFAE